MEVRIGSDDEQADRPEPGDGDDMTPIAEDAGDRAFEGAEAAAPSDVTPPRRQHHRLRAVLAVACVALAAAAAAATVLAWSQVRVAASPDALASVVLPALTGRVTAVRVDAANGTRVPVTLAGGDIWPTGTLQPGQRLTIEVTVQRPSWAAWALGPRQVSSFSMVTPVARLRDTWLQATPGTPVRAVFDVPVRVIALGGSAAQTLASAVATIDLPVTTSGGASAGSIEVAAVARSWESLPPPVRVTWFVARGYPQVLVDPSEAATLTPDGAITLTFSDPIATVLGTARPRLSPSVPGDWHATDAHTLVFQPAGSGFKLGTTVRATLPRAVHVAGRLGTQLTKSLAWRVPEGSTLRLEQLLAQLGYLPLEWQPSSYVGSMSVAAQLDAAVSPPPGQFTWRYPNTPPELRALWVEGRPNEIVFGAIMRYEDSHGLAVDGLAGPTVWSALIDDVVSGRGASSDYNYVFVHRSVPQLLSLWHDGRVILTSPGNTGVPAAPTQLGTFPVFEHIPVGTMSGTNPDGSKYKDPGIRWISYFHNGEALHAFPRATFGTPQSLGCVELPLDAAAKVWPYTPIGTLVTIEN